MVASMTDSELGRVLLTLRGVQWIIGTKDDPYALLLRVASEDPHELGRKMRDRGALYWSSADAWVTASHGLAAAALRDPRLSPRRADSQEPPDEEPGEEPMPWDVPALNDVLPLHDASVSLDRTECDRLRRLTEPLIGADSVHRYRSDVTRIYEQYLSGLDDQFDLMNNVARASATTVVCTLFGLPPDQHARFAELCAGAASALDATLCPPRLHTARELMASVSGIRTMVAESIEPKREAGDGLIGQLLRAAADEESPANDVLAVCMLLAVVGVEATANLICNATSVLLDHPEQWKLLRDDLALVPKAIEETLRYAPPIRLQRLFAREDIELGGQQVEAGTELVVVVEAANRDPAVYTEPDRFDIQREPPAEHLSLYGAGLYTGLIAPMVRLQAVAAVRAIATRLPEIRRTDDVLRRLRSPITTGVLRFPVAGR